MTSNSTQAIRVASVALAAITITMTITRPVAADSAAACSIHWHEAVKASFPYVEKACEGVVVRNGKRYATLTASVLNATPYSVSMRLNHVPPSERGLFMVATPPNQASGPGAAPRSTAVPKRGDLLTLHVVESGTDVLFGESDAVGATVMVK